MNWKKSWSFYHNKKRNAARGLTGLWAFLMLTLFPLFMGEGYFQLGEYKYRFFLWTSLLCLLPTLLLVCLEWLEKGAPVRAEKVAGVRRAHGPIDLCMMLYLAAAGLSWAFGIDRREGFTGVEGWHMGLLTQALFVLAYFLVSRLPDLKARAWRTALFAGHLLGSGLAFAVGLGQRFGLDPLGLYERVAEADRIRFLSTVGQASWYSGYVCMALTVSVTVFFLTKNPAARLAAGVHCALGFAAAVTQNSDSAFPALGALLFGLFWAACDDPDRMERFLETVLLMLFSFKAVGICRGLFPERAMALGDLSVFFAESLQTWIALCAVSVCYTFLLYRRQRFPERTALRRGRLLRRLAAGGAAAALCAAVLAIWLNTAGTAGADMPGQGASYLVFNDQWGNSRGFIWKLTAEAWLRLPPGRKLTGVGPDCFRAYCYADAALKGRIEHIFGWNQVLVNAHNEFLNALFCLGILGAAAYAGLFFVSIRRFLAEGRRSTPALMGALAALVYAAHNFFCYQQICCAPYLFLFLGLAENLSGNGPEGAADRAAAGRKRTAEKYIA